MESCLLIALALAALALPVAGLVVAMIALRRSARLSDRIADLELDVSRLRRQEAAEGAEAAPQEEPEPAPAASRTEAPEEPPEEPEPRPAPEAPPPPHPEIRTEPARPALEAPAPESPPDEPAGDGGGVDWERWIGLRGAAALAGVLLALAGLYFVRYSIEAGWLAPPVRVALGLAAGVAALLGSQTLRRRGYEDASNGLAGGGVVVLYAAVWAARILYELIPTALAFVLMVLITAVCGLLAWRRASLVVALLGLIGGFATPLLVGSETESPLGLFGYLLLLNAGLLLLARHRRWPLLPPLSLLATLFYEGLWILDRMEPADLPVTLGILTLFAALFALAAGRRPAAAPTGGAQADDEGAPGAGVRGVAVRRAGLGSLWRATRGAAVLLPFLFALYFAGRADLGQHLWPVAAMLLVLSVGAEWLARSWGAAGEGGAPGEPGELNWLGSAAAVFATTVTAVWALDGRADTAIAWETTAIAVALALGFHLFVEVDLARLRRAGGDRGVALGAPRAVSALLAAAGLLGLLIVDPLADPHPHAAARLVGWGVIAALLVRQTALPDVRRRQVAATAAVGAALPLFHLVHDSDPRFPEPSFLFGLLIAAGIALQVLPAARERPGGLDETDRRWAEGAAAALPLAALATLTLGALAWDPAPWLLLATSLALGLLATLAATRIPSGAVLFLAMLLTALLQTAWGSIPEISGDLSPAAHLLGLGAGTAAVLWFAAWPFFARPRLDAHRWAWYAAALAGPAWFPALREHWLERFGDGAVGLLPVLLGAVALGGAFRVASVWEASDPGRLRGLVWFSAVALGAAALAIPLQLDREWVTVGWALEGVAVIALWRRLEHPGLKLFGLALLATAAARLLLDPAGWIGAPPDAAAAWLAYTHLVPVAALVGAALLLGPLEVVRLERGPDWQRRLYPAARPLGAVVCGAGAILVGFVWINRTVLAVYGPGPLAAGAPADSMARDLTLSLAWAVYALLLAGLGFARSSRGLRGVGLGLLALTVVKLFLYDLSGLEDLYRVASLVGLALSLMLVSLAYQRFVFRSSAEERSGRTGDEPGPEPKEPS